MLDSYAAVVHVGELYLCYSCWIVIHMLFMLDSYTSVVNDG